MVASIQYRTVLDGATYKDSVADVKAAIRYLRANAKAYGIDPDHVAVWGQSAGSYLAAMAGVTGNVTAFDQSDDRGPSSSVQAEVDEFGPADLGKAAVDFDPSTQAAYAQPENPIAAFVLGSPGRLVDSPVAAGPANPASYISRSTPPFLILHGDDDRLVSPSQTATLHRALQAAGIDSTRYVLHGANHGTWRSWASRARDCPGRPARPWASSSNSYTGHWIRLCRDAGVVELQAPATDHGTCR
jgi:acetyl esterase/lipase